MLGLAGDLQPLKNAMELQKGENEILKGEMKLLRESHDTHKASVQKQKQELDEQLLEQQDRLAKLDEHLKNQQLSHNGLAENLETVKTVASQGGDVNAFPLAEVDYPVAAGRHQVEARTQCRPPPAWRWTPPSNG